MPQSSCALPAHLEESTSSLDNFGGTSSSRHNGILLFDSMAKAVDGALGATVFHPSESLVGKHVRAQVGQLVTMSAQGLLRRKEANRSDPSRGGLGTIVRVNANWTCDVKWHNTNQTREGYACGTVCSGGKSRAFHLCVVDSSAIIPPGPREGPPEPDRPFDLNSQRMNFNAYPAEVRSSRVPFPENEH